MTQSASAGTIVLARACRRAEAAVLAPFDYTSMQWAALFGFLLWRDLPTPAAAAGVVVIAPARGCF